jgi:NADPH:quinone reductase-like Zn-dependent oxidoreductase
LDLVGASYFTENLASLASRGRLMLVGLTGGATSEFNLGTALYKRLQITGTTLRGRSIEEKAAAVSKFESEVVPLLTDTRVRPNLDKVFPASEIVEAHRYLESNESFGKVVIEF